MRAILRDMRDAVADHLLVDGKFPSVGGIPDLMAVFRQLLGPRSPLANALRGLLCASDGSVAGAASAAAPLSNQLAAPHKYGHIDAEFAFRATVAAYDLQYRQPDERFAALALMAYLAATSSPFSTLLAAWIGEITAVSRSLTDTLALVRCLIHQCGRPCASTHQAHCQRRAARVAAAGVRHIAQCMRTALRCPALSGGGGPLHPDAAALCDERWDLDANFRLWAAVAWASGSSPPPKVTDGAEEGGNAGADAVCAMLATTAPAPQSASSPLASSASLPSLTDDDYWLVSSLARAGSGFTSVRASAGSAQSWHCALPQNCTSLPASPLAGAAASPFAVWNARALAAAGDFRALVDRRTSILMHHNPDPSEEPSLQPRLFALREAYITTLRGCLCGAAATAADSLSLDRAIHVVAAARLRAAVLARGPHQMPTQLSGPLIAAQEAVLWHASRPPAAHEACRLASLPHVRTVVPVIDTGAFAEAWSQGQCHHDPLADPGDERIALGAYLLEAVAASSTAASDTTGCGDGGGGSGGAGDGGRDLEPGAQRTWGRPQRAFGLTFSMRPSRVTWADGGVSGGLAAFADALCRGKAPIAGAGLLDPVQAVRKLARIRRQECSRSTGQHSSPAAAGLRAAASGGGGDGGERARRPSLESQPDLLLVVTGMDIRRALRVCTWLKASGSDSAGPSAVGAALMAACATAWADEWRRAGPSVLSPPPPPHVVWANLHGLCESPVVMHVERPAGGAGAAMGLVEIPGGRMTVPEQMAFLAEAAAPLVAGAAAPATDPPLSEQLLRRDEALAAVARDPRYQPRNSPPRAGAMERGDSERLQGPPTRTPISPTKLQSSPVRAGSAAPLIAPRPQLESASGPGSAVCAMGEVVSGPPDSGSHARYSGDVVSGSTFESARRNLAASSVGSGDHWDSGGSAKSGSSGSRPSSRCVPL